MLLVALIAIAGSASCRRHDRANQASLLPAPVAPVAYEPEQPVADPEFTARAGATAYYGEANRGAYRIEIPDQWNHKLVMYLHGDHQGFSSLTVDLPPIRDFLMRNGYAWAAASYGTNRFVTGLAADETAALWDLFAERFGRPERTYLLGESMGGGGTVISAERYANRYDGALAHCGIADATTTFDVDGDMFVTAAFAAGVSQAEFDAGSPLELLRQRIMPAMDDPTTRGRFDALWIDLSGGKRPFDTEGLRLAGPVVLGQGAQTIAVGLYDNAGRTYHLSASVGVSDDNFNRQVIRVQAGDARRAVPESEDFTGDIQIPLLTLQTTGDFNVVLLHQQLLQRRVDGHNKGDLLVQRAVQAPEHCGALSPEIEAAFEALVDWVENGQRPAGDDVAAADLSGLGVNFTWAPRVGSSAGDSIAGASKRLTIRGRVSVEGEQTPVSLLTVLVRDGGLVTTCNLTTERPSPSGDYQRVVAADAELPGCGKPGAEILLATQFGASDLVLARETGAWPDNSDELQLDASFSRSDLASQMPFYLGSVFDVAGRRFGGGTVVEAEIDGKLCGRAVIPAVGRGADLYALVISGQPVTDCDVSRGVEFFVNGKPASRSDAYGRRANLIVGP